MKSSRQLLLGGVRRQPEPRRGAVGDDALAGCVDLIEQLVEALAGNVGKRLADRLADPVVAVEEATMGVVDELEDMVRATQDADEAGCLLEQVRQTLPLGRCLALCQNLPCRLGADDQNAADAVGCRRVVDRAVAVGPEDLLEHAVPDDRHELVLVPGGPLAAQDELDLRSDDVPAFRPGLASGRAQHRRMLSGAEGRPIAVIVEADVLLAPEDKDRVARREGHPDRGLQPLRPGLGRPQRRGAPVVGAHERAHLAATGEELGQRWAMGEPLGHENSLFFPEPCRNIIHSPPTVQEFVSTTDRSASRARPGTATAPVPGSLLAREIPSERSIGL